MAKTIWLSRGLEPNPSFAPRTLSHRLAVKRSLLAASFHLQESYEPNHQTWRCEADAKIPLKSSFRFNAEAHWRNAMPGSPFYFESYSEGESVSGRLIVWTIDEEGARFSESRKGAEIGNAKVDVSVDPDIGVLSPLQIPRALQRAHRSEAKEYGTYIVAGKSLQALKLVPAEASKGQLQFDAFVMPVSGACDGESWKRLAWAEASKFSLSIHEFDLTLLAIRFRAPLVGEIELAPSN